MKYNTTGSVRVNVTSRGAGVNIVGVLKQQVLYIVCVCLCGVCVVCVCMCVWCVSVWCVCMWYVYVYVGCVCGVVCVCVV